MELLLNLAWLLLLVPAYWLWRRGGATRACRSMQCLLALACVLVILFPVVSATDDLLAMRTEMEESPISKRSLHEAGGEGGPIWNARGQHAAALVAPIHLAPANGEDRQPLWRPALRMPAAPAAAPTSRAPPQDLPV